MFFSVGNLSVSWGKGGEQTQWLRVESGSCGGGGEWGEGGGPGQADGLEGPQRWRLGDVQGRVWLWSGEDR